jgi:hypothetical protein
MSEVIVPDVVGDSLPVQIQARANRAVAHHRKAESALRDWAENVVLCGLELIRLKGEIGHKEWLPFLEANVSDISVRHVQRYMQVAAGFESQLGKKIEVADMSEAQRAKLQKAISKQTAATSWRQLMQDMGIGSGERQGRGGSESAPKRLGEGKHQAQAAAAADTLAHHVAELRDLVASGAHKLIPHDIRMTYAEALRDVCKELSK